MPETLTSKQAGQFLEALLDAFDRKSFEQMLLFNLDKRLDQIAASSTNNREAYFDVIKKAKQEGWLMKLVNNAYEEVPGNIKLKEFADSISAGTQSPSNDSAGSTASVAKQKYVFADTYDIRELRRRMAEGLSTEEIDQICIELNIPAVDFIGGVNARVMGVVQYLDRRDRLPDLIKALKADFPYTLKIN